VCPWGPEEPLVRQTGARWDPSIGRVTDSAASDARFLLRNAVDGLPEGALEAKLASGRRLRVKLGIDPTAPDIHLGHAVVLRKLREFQDLGHVVVLIVGDYTARVGDPSGRSSTRPQLDPATIDANAETFQRQAFSILDPERTEVRRNAEWLEMPTVELFALARTSTVAQILERDDFAQRYAARAPISVLELLYPLLQAYDSVAVRADVELGGTDQKFNLLLGREVQQSYGLEPQAVLTLPILPGISGVEKMSKSLGNHIAVTDAPEEVFGKAMRVPDATMPLYYELLVDGEAFDPARLAVESKRRLARRLTEQLHGSDAARAAEQHFDRLHRDHGVPDDVEQALLPPGDSVHLPALIAEHFGVSRSEARRLVAQGGVRLDGESLPAEPLDVPTARLDGAVLQLGRRRFKRFTSAMVEGGNRPSDPAPVPD